MSESQISIDWKNLGVWKAFLPVVLFFSVILVNGLHYGLVVTSSEIPGIAAIVSPLEIDILGSSGLKRVSSIRDADYRISIHSIGLLNLFVFVGSVFCGWRIISSLSHQFRAPIGRYVIISCGLLFFIAIWFAVSHQNLWMGITETIYNKTIALDAYRNSQSGSLLQFMIFYSVLPVWVAFLFCTVSSVVALEFFGKQNWTKERLRERNKQLQLMLYFAALILVLRLVMAFCFSSWMGEYIADPVAAKEHSALEQSLLFSIGIASSSMLLAFYLPTMLIFKGEINRVALGELKNPTAKTISEWMDEHGFTVSSAGQALRLLTFLSPILTGASMEFVTTIIKQGV